MGVKNRLKEILDERGIKQTWLADRVGMSRTTLSNIVNNRHNPSIDVAIKICKFLGVRVEDVFIIEDD